MQMLVQIYIFSRRVEFELSEQIYIHFTKVFLVATTWSKKRKKNSRFAHGPLHQGQCEQMARFFQYEFIYGKKLLDY